MRFIESKGSFHDVGRAVGAACRPDMRGLYERVVAYLADTTTAGSLRRMRATALGYSKRTDRGWKEASAFLHGLAEGSGMAFEEIAVIAYSSSCPRRGDRSSGTTRITSRTTSDRWSCSTRPSTGSPAASA